ncbi:MAG TPA: RNA chaperone Hfq [Terriglobales bacterium]|nr:RNA chaperone Hfq [Terriglobales bacterium]
MKDGMDSTAVRRAPEAADDFANRKLIRPSLSRSEGNHMPSERRDRPIVAKKTPPPEQTHAENFYYQKQIQSKTPMVVVLRDGEQVHGTIEWYDKNCIKVIRPSGNLLIYKPAIKYMFKEGEETAKG